MSRPEHELAERLADLAYARYVEMVRDLMAAIDADTVTLDADARRALVERAVAEVMAET